MNRARSEEPRTHSEPANVLVFCGPSGIGKSTLIGRLMSDFPGRFGFSVSHTTRPSREGELNGVNYHFVDRKKMEQDIAEGKFLEYANVHENLYGTSFAAIQAVQETGKICVLDIDVQGVENVKKSSYLDQGRIVFVMLVPPSLEVLEQRLRARKTDSEEVIARRLANAKSELMWQYRGQNYWDKVLVNDDINQCYSELVSLVRDFFFQLNTQSRIGTLSVRKSAAVQTSSSSFQEDDAVLFQ